MIGSTILERTEHPGWEPHVFLQTPFSERAGKLSPDGAFCRILFGRIGLRRSLCTTLSRGRRKVTVSSNGGTKMRWSRDGKELFYVEGQTLVAVSVSSGSSFSVGSATRLFEHPGLRPGINYPPYDVSADGQRFILAEPVGGGRGRPQAVDPRGPELVRRIPRPPAGLSPTKRTT